MHTDHTLPASALEPIVWPDDSERPTVLAAFHMAFSEPCTCLLTDTGALGAAVRDFHARSPKS